ncbi:MAG: peptide deformylase [Gammaproteobacteria bacterium]|uniref:Peptide deformylase n=1 Tax=Candidatus Thiopontia autotrophica TaxID=2841688 RepID=A0A8J6NWW2_9GAMM|nr:peptide deformylase [Candidatus Thiopontia autotrophica]
MAILDILHRGDPKLEIRARLVTDFDKTLRTIVSDMWETMHESEGVGLAATQVGIDLQLVVFGMESSSRYPDSESIPYTVLINPTVEPLGDDLEEEWEGCLSIPGLRGLVPRYSQIRYSGVDIDGKPFECEAAGFHARVVQHECDHLLGILYPERMENPQELVAEEDLEDIT